MAHPSKWDEAMERLKRLFPESKERGKIRAKLLELEDSKWVAYFQDDDEAVKESLAYLAAAAGPSVAGTEPEEKPTAPPSARQEVAQYLLKRLPRPSSYSRNNPDQGWPDPALKRLLKFLRTHRPATLPDEKFTQLPVGLLSPILAQVEEDCAYGQPAAADSDFAARLGEAMSDKFRLESDRRERFLDLLRNEFSMPLQRTKVGGDNETDGSSIIPVWGAYAMAVNTEVKLEVGSGGGDPRIQNATYAALQASDMYEILGRFSYCPTLLIELAGPNMALSGFAFGQYASCDQLSQMVSLLRQPKSEIAIGAPRVIFALRGAWSALQAYYRGLTEKPMPAAPTQQLAFPYPNSYKLLGGDAVKTFRYVQRLTDFTFTAESMGMTIFVKFCKRYSPEAHLVVEKAGYAPRLLGFERLPGCWLLVVTEYLDSAAHWNDAMTKPADSLRAAVKVMHDTDNVHGDLRSPNVLVKDDKVYLVDFEWAGKAGVVTYPLFMNRETEKWPEGATDGQPITKRHDSDWVEKLTKAA